MASEFFDHAYATGMVGSQQADHLYASVLEQPTPEPAGITHDADADQEPSGAQPDNGGTLFTESPRKVRVETVQGSDLDVLHSKLLVQDELSALNGVTNGNASDSEHSDSDIESLAEIESVDGKQRKPSGDPSARSDGEHAQMDTDNTHGQEPTGVGGDKLTSRVGTVHDESGDSTEDSADGTGREQADDGPTESQTDDWNAGREVGDSVDTAGREVGDSGDAAAGSDSETDEADEGETGDDSLAVENSELDMDVAADVDTSLSEPAWNEAVEGTAGVVARTRGRPRKKKRKWGHKWSTTPNKRRRSSSNYGRFLPALDLDSATVESDVVVDEKENVDIEAGDQTEVGTDASEIAERRRSRTPAHSDIYVVGDDNVSEEIKKHGGLQKVRSFGNRQFTPLTEEEIEVYRPPFTHGWWREVVIRGVYNDITASGKSKMAPADVYYHPPIGTKIRSMVQIQDYLNTHDTPLSTQNFSFMRKPIGVGEGEKIRHASWKRGRASMAAAARKRGEDSPTHSTEPEIVIERVNDHDFLSPLAGADTPKRRLGRPRKKTEVLVESSKIEVIIPSNEQVIVSPSKKRPAVKATARKSTTQKSFRPNRSSVTPEEISMGPLENLCTLMCPGLEEIPPLLNCKVCMCMFHPECVNYRGFIDDNQFVCLRCESQCESARDSSVSVEVEDGIMRLPNVDTTIMRVNAPSTFGSRPQAANSPQVYRVSPSGTQTRIPSFNSLLSQTGSPGQASSAMPSIVYRPINPSVPVIAANSPSPVQMRPLTLASRPGSAGLIPVFVSGGMIQTQASSLATVRPNPGATYTEIRPALPKDGVRIKQEPVDPSDPDMHAQSTGAQASSEALGNLKTVLSGRLNHTGGVDVVTSSLSSMSQATYSKNALYSLLDAKAGIRTVAPSQTTNKQFVLSTTGGMNSPSLVRLPINTTNPTELFTSSGLKLVPVGLPIRMPVAATTSTTLAAGSKHAGNMNVICPVATSSLLTTTTSATSSITAQRKNSADSNLLALSQNNDTAITKTTNSTKTITTLVNPNTICAPKNGQLLTLPQAVVKRLTLSRPLQLKINNIQLNVPPSGFFNTPDGLKVFVPPNTFPTCDEDVCLTVSDGKDTQSSNVNSVVVSPASTSGTKTSESKSTDSSTKSQKSQDAAPDGKQDSGKEQNETKKSPADIRKSKRYNTSCFVQRLHGGFETLLHIFQYLNIRDLISAGLTCRAWRDIAKHQSLWVDASFQGMKVGNWERALQYLARRKVQGISLVGLKHYDDANRTWHQLVSAIQDAETIKRMYFGLVPASVLHSLCERLARLEVFSAMCVTDFNNEAMWTRPTKLDVGKFASLTSLMELRLKGVGGLTPPSFSFSGGMPDLALLTNLQILSLTSLRNLPENSFDFLKSLTKLHELALGDCITWTAETFTYLGGLTSLRKLRLEEGGTIPDRGLGQALANLQQLEWLELYTYTIADTLGTYLVKLPKLKTLILWPDNSILPTEVNTNTLSAVTPLTWLTRLDWVIPSSSSSSIILDVEPRASPGSQQWIPFYTEARAPSPTDAGDTGADTGPGGDQPRKRQTEYIGVHQLTQKLVKFLPTTRIKVYCLKSCGGVEKYNAYAT